MTLIVTDVQIIETVEVTDIKGDSKKKERNFWPLRAFLIALILSAVMSFFSSEVLEDAGIVIAAVLLLLIILLGVIFDMIGTAVTAASIKPFHAMSAHKEKGGKQAVRLIQNANKVNSICNDIVGDICAVIAGTTGTILVEYLEKGLNTRSVLISICVTALVSSLTIGGKAVGKTYAMKYSTKIVTIVAKIISIVKKK